MNIQTIEKKFSAIIKKSKNDASQVDILFFFSTSSNGYTSSLTEFQMTIYSTQIVYKTKLKIRPKICVLLKTFFLMISSYLF